MIVPVGEDTDQGNGTMIISVGEDSNQGDTIDIFVYFVRSLRVLRGKKICVLFRSVGTATRVRLRSGSKPPDDLKIHQPGR